MKSLRRLTLALTIAAATFAFAQQEVDPDHFDQPTAAATQTHKAAKVHHRTTAVASKHSRRRHSHNA